MKRNHAFYRGVGLLFITVIALLLAVSLVAAAQTDSTAAVTGALAGDSLASGLAQATPVKPPIPGGRPSPLRVMVPTDQTWQALQAAGITDITQISPYLDPIASFSPGPRMELFPGRPAGAPGFEAAPANPFRTLAILVQFTDKPAQVGATFFDTLVFGASGGTVRGYYQEVSYGLLDIVTLNLPSAIGWRTAPQTYAYYTNGDNCLGSYPQNCQRLTEDVVALVNPVVNFANYDNNGDGYVDTVFIIHSGTGAEANGGDPNTIWSHSWWTYNEPLVDGVRVGSYTTEPEFWFTPGDMTHGVYVHELGHAFGLPDLYDIDNTSRGVGNWSLMSGGSWNGYLGNSPAHLDAWSRVYLEFNPVVNITGYNGTISLPNVQQNRANAIYRFNSGKANEYWLLENRQKIGSDASLPGSGLLIWHVDDNLSGSNRYECKQANNYQCPAPQHFRVALEQADGALHLEFNSNSGDSGDPFPGSTGKTSFNFTTNPNTTSYYLTTNWGFQVSSISPSASTMTAYVGETDPPPTLVLPTLTPSITPTPSATPSPTATVPVPDTPVLLTPPNGSATNDNTPTFTWGVVSGATSYRIQADNNADFSSLAINSTRTSPTYVRVTALTDGLYYWRVQAKGANGIWGPWSAVWTVTIDTVKPAKPTLLSPVKDALLTTNRPAFDWGDVLDAVRYDLQVDNSSTFGSPEVVASPAGSAYTVTTPLADGRYYWRVRAVDLAGNSGSWSSAWTVWVDIDPTPAPTLVSPPNGSATNDNTPTFIWGAVTGATSYRIQASTKADFSSTVVNSTRSSVTYTPATALLDGLYYWRVQARGGDGIWGLWSAVWTVTVDTAKPAKPTLLSPVKDALVTTNQPAFDWGDVLDAVRYDLQVDNSSTFSSPEVVASPAGSAYTVTTPLADGRYYWRVRAVDLAGNIGSWSSAWTVWVDIDPAPAPTLVSPADGTPTRDNTPTFTWNVVPGLTSYRIQVSKSAAFSSTVVNSTRSSTTYTPATALLDGLYYWRVQARGGDGIWGLWSAVWTVTVDTVAPAKPTLLSPETKSILNTSQPALDWSDVADAAHYELQIDNSSTFGSPEVFTSVTPSAYTVSPPLPNGKYFWRVRTYDLAGNRSGWTSARSFTLAYSPAPLEMATPTPTPTLTSTLETPVSGPGLIEAESDSVGRSGTWTAHETAAASGGSYLYSSGSSEDALSLTFQGAQVSMIYVKHPALGVIVVEIDGTPIQLLDSLAEESVFGVQATFALAEGQHTLRVYPMMGTIALDAFLVEAGVTPTVAPEATAEVPATPDAELTTEPTVEPTVEPPIEPTVELTIEPTAEPTATPPPLLTPPPTVTPDPLTMVIEAESASVLPGGLWTRVESLTASGGAYLMSSGQEAREPDALTLVFSGARVEVIYATGPALGKFLVEVDGLPVQLVDARADLPDFAARLAFTLGAGQHTLRLVASEGVIAVDAFVVPREMFLPATPIQPPTEPPTLTPTATLPPTDMPLPTEVPPTPEPPTATPLPPEPPTATPVPTEPPPPEPTEGANAPDKPF